MAEKLDKAEQSVVDKLNESAASKGVSTMAGDLNPAFYPNSVKSEPMQSQDEEKADEADAASEEKASEKEAQAPTRTAAAKTATAAK